MTATGPLFHANFGNSDNDQRQAVTISILYQLPFGRGKQFAGNAPKAVDYVVGGWQFNPFWFAGTGTPDNITINPASGSSPGNRPDYLGSASVGEKTKNANGTYQWFKTSAFAPPPTVSVGGNAVYTRPGTLARNTIPGPGYNQLTASLFKNIPITSRIMGQLRFEAYNLLNHPDFIANRYTTRFIDNTPELFQVRKRRDRATKLLRYIADVTVNGQFYGTAAGFLPQFGPVPDAKAHGKESRPLNVVEAAIGECCATAAIIFTGFFLFWSICRNLGAGSAH